MSNGVDILMITYNRPEYTDLALRGLLETCNDESRVWVWHNGMDADTLAVVNSLRDHPRLHRFHHSQENVRLTEPTNWFWSNAQGDFFSKVDDDCLLPKGWIEKLVEAHNDVPEFGALGCWRFPEEDYEPAYAEKKLRTFNGKHTVMVNCWVEGSGYLMKRQCIETEGLLKEGQSFTNYCVHLNAKGWHNGWYYPFIEQEHMDDPRAEHTLLKTDADMLKYLPLSAKRSGITTLAEWQAQLRRSAHIGQSAPYDPGAFIGWRGRVRNATKRVKNLIGGTKGDW